MILLHFNFDIIEYFSSIKTKLMATYKLQINGKTLQADVEPDTPLLWVLRDHLSVFAAN